MANSNATQGLTAKDNSGLVRIRENNAKLIERAMGQSIAAALEEIGLVAERFAKGETPVDTGRLRNSITHAIDKESAYIGTNVEYAPAVELGTHGRDGVGMLHHAAADHGDLYRSILHKHMSDS